MRAPERSARLPQTAEPGPHLIDEQLGLFPGGEVTAFCHLVVVDEVGVGGFGPLARGLVKLIREDTHRNWHLDALGRKESELVFPIEASG